MKSIAIATPKIPIIITNPGNGAQVRFAAAMAIMEVLQNGHSLKPALIQHSVKLTDARDLALTHEIAYGVLRILPSLRTLIATLMPRSFKSKDFDVECLLLVGLYQLKYLRIPNYAAVSQTVAAARLLGKPWANGLINATLRNFQRRTENVEQKTEGGEQRIGNRKPNIESNENGFISRIETSHCFPEWLATRIKHAWPNQASALMAASDHHPPMTLRVNLARITRHEYVAQLVAVGLTAQSNKYAPATLILDQPIAVTALPGFAAGLVTIQDAAAQLAAPLLNVEPEQQILDACSAPGGKLGHILELCSTAKLTAVDVDAERLKRVRETLARLKIGTVRVLQADLMEDGGRGADDRRQKTNFQSSVFSYPNWADRYYDRILLDVPCTATGIIRRHPDIKWLRRPTDIAPLVATQRHLLDKIWTQLKPGGILLYVTCSVLPEENHVLIADFLARTPNATELPINASWGHECSVGRQVLPGEHDMDGFYFARLIHQ